MSPAPVYTCMDPEILLPRYSAVTLYRSGFTDSRSKLIPGQVTLYGNRYFIYISIYCKCHNVIFFLNVNLHCSSTDSVNLHCSPSIASVADSLHVCPSLLTFSYLSCRLSLFTSTAHLQFPGCCRLSPCLPPLNTFSCLCCTLSPCLSFIAHFQLPLLQALSVYLHCSPSFP